MSENKHSTEHCNTEILSTGQKIARDLCEMDAPLVNTIEVDPDDVARRIDEEVDRLKNGAVCGDCDGSGWLQNRIEGRYPCTCMTEAEPYQIIEKQRDGLLKAMIDIQQVACSGSPELAIATEAIAAAQSNGQPEKPAETESAPAIVFFPSGSLGEEVMP